MQQAIQVDRAAPAASAGGEPVAAAANAFVINLVSSTTPVALTRPDHAGLRRFTFFVSRRREEGRERFRLHMGYFDTQEEAEKLLDIVRTIYPGAWAGAAPGRRLNNGNIPNTPNTPPQSNPPAPVAPPAAVAAPAPTGPPPTPAKVLALRPAAGSIEVSSLALVPDAGRRPLADITDAQLSSPPSPQEGSADRQAAARSLSNVREAIASLDDRASAASASRVSGAPTIPAVVPELRAAVIPTLQPPPPRKLATAAPVAAAAAAPLAPTVTVPVAAPVTASSGAPPGGTELSDTGSLRLLEMGTAAKSTAKSTKVDRPATVTPPRTLAGEPPTHASPQPPHPDKPYYAVQLMWSVQPIALTQLPQLAIFSAYTLYGAEGNRDGRRWYGLRLGFFTDAVSAKQVAHYVRGDFSTVSVVPVSEREREQAKLAVARVVGGPAVAQAPPAAKTGKVARGAPPRAGEKASAAPGARTSGKTRLKDPEFAFIDDLKPVPADPAQADAKQGATTAVVGVGRVGPAGRPSRGAPGKRAKVRPPSQIHARTPTKPKTLEETLEILGANDLKVDDEPGALLNDAGLGSLQGSRGKSKPSKLSQLFERLSERLGS